MSAWAASVVDLRIGVNAVRRVESTSMDRNAKRKIVVAGILEREGRVLVARRAEGSPGGLAGAWEFPGGKIEAGETAHEALKRELREELGVEIVVVDSEPLDVEDWKYDHGHFEIQVYRVKIAAGTAEPLEHAEIRWLMPADICRLQLLPADRPIAERLRDNGSVAAPGTSSRPRSS